MPQDRAHANALLVRLPDEIIGVLRWHVETQLVTEAQRDCELLFPSLDGDFRSGSVLNKPFKELSEAMGLGYKFTARGMRRTFNDLARTAHLPDVIARSI